MIALHNSSWAVHHPRGSLRYFVRTRFTFAHVIVQGHTYAHAWAFLTALPFMRAGLSSLDVATPLLGGAVLGAFFDSIRILLSLAPPSSFAVCCVPGRGAPSALQQPRYPVVRAIRQAVLSLLFVPGHVGVHTLASTFRSNEIFFAGFICGYARRAVSLRLERPRECCCACIWHCSYPSF